MIKLYYADLNNTGDIPEFEFSSPKKLVNFLDSKIQISNKDRVYLVVGDEDYLFITIWN